MPGTPLTMDMAEQNPDKKISDADLKRLNRIYGLDKPWHVAYFQWLGNVGNGDFGRSFKHKKPVTKIIGERVGPTLMLSGTSLLLTYLLAIPLGLFATARRGKFDERVLSTFLYMLYAVPTFVAGLLLLVLFYQKLAGTPSASPGMYSENYDELNTWDQVVDRFKHMLLPVICFTYGGLAYFSRFIKSNMEEVVRQDYIRQRAQRESARCA